MKVTISTTDAARNLGDCLARIKHTGDSFLLLKNDKPVAELVPLAGSRAITLRELWRIWSEIPTDPDFARDLERVNRADQVLDNPWA